MQAEPSPDPTPPSSPDQDPTKRVPEDDRGSDAEVIGTSTDLDFVDEALDALDQDDLERAEELAERLQSSDTSDQS